MGRPRSIERSIFSDRYSIFGSQAVFKKFDNKWFDFVASGSYRIMLVLRKKLMKEGFMVKVERRKDNVYIVYARHKGHVLKG